MLTQEVIVVTEGVLRARENEPARRDREMLDEHGVAEAGPERLGHGFVDIRVQQELAVPLRGDPANLALFIQTSQNFHRSGPQTILEVRRKSPGIEQQERSGVGSSLDQITHG
jgi:hypothetical protein